MFCFQQTADFMASPPPSTATGSKSLDWVLFLGILASMVLATPRILVYCSTTPAKIYVIAITAAGERIALKTPKPLRGIRPSILGAERDICRYARTPAAQALTPPAGRLEWSLRHQLKGMSHTRIINTGDPR